MDKFPELKKILGEPKNKQSRLIFIFIILILIVLVVIIFLIATGYIALKSPTDTGASV